MIKHLYRFLLRNSWPTNTLLLFIVSRCISLILALVVLTYTLLSNDIPPIIGGPTITNWQSILYGIAIAPILETLLYCSAVFFFFETVIQTDRHPLWTIIASATCFSLAHGYSLLYPILVFPSGIIYAFSYHFFKRTKSISFAIMCVTLLHALNNISALLYSLAK